MGEWNRPLRWLALSCLVAPVMALSLSACGDHSPAATAKAPKVSATARSTPVTQGVDGCAGQVGEFLDAMDSLRTNLVAGLSYEQYVGEVEAITATYRRIPARRLGLGCLKAAGTPGESALNEYISASNAWSDCVEAPGCESASVEPALQSRWRQASKLLSEAQRGLKEAAR